MLSVIAQQFADEIRLHDWNDAPYRADRAGHQRASDGSRQSKQTLTSDEVEILRLNVVWVVGQVLGYNDGNFNIHEFGEAAGVAHRFLRNTDGRPSGIMDHGLRRDHLGDRRYYRPGTYQPDPVQDEKIE